MEVKKGEGGILRIAGMVILNSTTNQHQPPIRNGKGWLIRGWRSDPDGVHVEAELAGVGGV